MKKLGMMAILMLGLAIAACDSEDPSADFSEAPPLKTSVNVKLKIGEFLYENIDATITVEGLSSSDEVVWSQEYSYEGGTDNVIEIAGGHDHYELKMTKWGVEDTQVATYQQLFADRADGSTPSTYVFGGELQAKKLASVTRFWQEQSGMTPSGKEIFEWTNNRLSKIRAFEYNKETMSFQEVRYYILAYMNNKVSAITGYQLGADVPFIVTSYTYLPNGNVSQIKEENSGSGITTIVDLVYDHNNGKVAATYTISNGNSFTYEFDYVLKNVAADKTTRDGTLCSHGTYEYDKNINPFRHLGYMDLFLNNFSINNKVDEEINHMACSFPTLIPEGFDHEYDDDGYPTKTTVQYSNDRQSELHYAYH